MALPSNVPAVNTTLYNTFQEVFCYFRMKIKGEMPLVSLNISDHRLQEILSMVQSIPLPETGGEEPEDIFADVSCCNQPK